MDTKTQPGSIRGSEAFKELKRRKQAEHDAAVLRNRILQLERQAQRADKRIEQTRQRAKDILEHRERNEQRERDRKQALDELQSYVQYHHENATR
jgi:predicted ribosome quality control (RQC) complex YloA/Tae2 family protein